jgi:hypothetical protein
MFVLSSDKPRFSTRADLFVSPKLQGSVRSLTALPDDSLLSSSPPKDTNRRTLLSKASITPTQPLLRLIRNPPAAINSLRSP